MAIRERSLTGSEALWKQAMALMPNGTQTLSKGPAVFVDGVHPKYLQRGQGSHVWDVDGNEYIDYGMACASVILGYAYPCVAEAIAKQAYEGTNFTMMHPLETDVAQLLVAMVPCAEMVRFAKNGSDATSAAVRIARAYTGREKIAHCGYHGWEDWYAIGTPRRRGIPKILGDYLFTFKWNDPDSLRQIFQEHPGEVAAIILEHAAEMPKDGFLQQVTDLAHDHGALVIFDEIYTGFRYAVGGAQEYFGVIPDLVALGKAMSNGMPLSAVAGSREIMKDTEDVFFSMTFGGETASLAAAKACLTEIRKGMVISFIWTQGRKLMEGFNRLAKEIQLRAEATCLPPKNAFDFYNSSGTLSSDIKSLFLQEMCKRGVIMGFGFNLISYSHSDADISDTLEAIGEALQVVKKATDEGNIDKYMEGRKIETVFRSTRN